jgi:hypothetical protein
MLHAPLNYACQSLKLIVATFEILIINITNLSVKNARLGCEQICCKALQYCPTHALVTELRKVDHEQMDGL